MGRTRNSRVARGRSRSSGASGDTFLAAYDLDVVPWASWSAVSGWTPVRTDSSTYLGMGYLNETAGDADVNDYAEWSVCLGAGTYTFTAIGQTAADAGIVTYALDGASLGTADWYSAGTVANVVKQLTSLTVAGGVQTLRATVTSKHASSSDYRMAHQWFTFTRTGA